MGWNAQYRQPWGLITPGIGAVNRSLEKRINWILTCASVESFYLIAFDDWKTNKFRIFIEVTSVREYYVERVEAPFIGPLFELIPKVGELFKEQVTLWRTKPLDPHSCYYLGQYPWHWSYEWGHAIPPMGGTFHEPFDKKIRDLIAAQKDEPWTGPHNGPYEGTPGIPGEYGITLENLDEEELIFYYGKRKYGNYLAQQEFTDHLNTRLKNCIAQNYPPQGWKPKVKVREAGADFDWPGNPVKSLDPPIPMGRRALPPGMEQTTTSVTAALYYSPPEREDGLTLDLEIT